eukprot:1146510-Pelagomonas_calceolata.AAC.9
MAVCHTSKNTSAGGALRACPKDIISDFNASFQQLQHVVPQLLLCIALIACEPLVPLAAGPLHAASPPPPPPPPPSKAEPFPPVFASKKVLPDTGGIPLEHVLAQLALVLHPLALSICIILRLWH